MILVLAFSAAPVEAKRFGGGKSWGKSHQTAPAKQAPQKKDAAPAVDKAKANQGAAGKGMMGGMLGGLLAGGLLGYLLGNGAFEGLQFMDMLLFGLIALVIFKVLRGRKTVTAQSAQPAFTMPGANQQAQARQAFSEPSATADNTSARQSLVSEIGGFSASSVPVNLPADFDLTQFLIGAREHYRTLQNAWNINDLSLIEEYVSPELYQELKAERLQLAEAQHTEVLFVDAELVRADYNAELAELSIQFTGRYRDETEAVEEDIHDIWHLERDLQIANAPWLIVGIEA